MNRNRYFCTKTNKILIISHIYAELSRWSGEQDTIIKSKFFETILDGELKYVMRKRLSKRQCKMSVCIYKLSCPACAK